MAGVDDLRPELAAVELRLARVYRSAQRVIDAELERIASDPALWRRRGRLIAMQRRIEVMLRQVDQQAAAWLARDLPRIYQMGAGDGAALAGVFTQVNRAAVSRIAHDTMLDLLAATRHVDADVRALIQRVAGEAVTLKITTGQTATQAARRMAEVVEEQGVSAVVYRNGARVDLDTYAEMVVRTKSAVAYSRGSLDGAPEVQFWQLLDGPGCGLTSHDDPEQANGMIVPREVAEAFPVAHPRCVAAGTRMATYGDIVELQRAWFRGPIIEMTTASNRRVTVGPHHPVLTSRGWRAAHLIEEGDQLVQDNRLDNNGRSLTTELDFEQMPRAEDVFLPLRALGHHSRVPRTADDLHGDAVFCDGEIDVVRPDRELLLEGVAALSQHAFEDALVGADVALGKMVLPGTPAALLQGVAPAPRRAVSGPHESGALSVAHLAPPQLQGVGIRSCEAESPDGAPNRGVVDVQQPGDGETAVLLNHVELVHPLSGQRAAACARTEPGTGGVARLYVETDATALALDLNRQPFLLDEVSAVRSYLYEGYVFDVTTTVGCFNADGIVVKNCRRALAPRPDVTSAVAAERARARGAAAIRRDLATAAAG